MRILLTGAGGFLGWHARVRLRALTDHEVIPVTRENWSDLAALADGVDAILHLAGVNRAASDADVEGGNVALAQDVADAALKAGTRPRIVYANSVQSDNGTPYGVGKADAGALLERAASEIRSGYVDVRLPNLFGEGGRPDYNSFVATFVHAVIAGQTPAVSDREIGLVHVQDAAAALIDALTASQNRVEPVPTPATVASVYDILARFHEVYRLGDFPALTSPFEVDLFNTLRTAMFPAHYPIALTSHADERGRLVETVRCAGGPGQTFISTTRPGVTRGNHFHLRKVERFVVLSGEARISLRRVFGDEVVSFDVSGCTPSIVDMPTMWVHNITNTGPGELTTLFWTNCLFDPSAPDTYWEKIAR